MILINTARGAIVEHKALLQALKDRRIGAYGADVYEKENDLFFKDHSAEGINDELLKELLSYNNVLLTPHQAFVTEEALENIARITIENLDAWEQQKSSKNEIGYPALTL